MKLNIGISRGVNGGGLRKIPSVDIFWNYSLELAAMEAIKIFNNDLFHANLITIYVSCNIIVFYSDISSLAKAAVAGDEAALDMLSWRKSNKSTSNTSSDYSFFFGVVEGKFILTRVI